MAMSEMIVREYLDDQFADAVAWALRVGNFIGESGPPDDRPGWAVFAKHRAALLEVSEALEDLLASERLRLVEGGKA